MSVPFRTWLLCRCRANTMARSKRSVKKVMAELSHSDRIVVLSRSVGPLPVFLAPVAAPGLVPELLGVDPVIGPHFQPVAEPLQLLDVIAGRREEGAGGWDRSESLGLFLQHRPSQVEVAAIR